MVDGYGMSPAVQKAAAHTDTSQAGKCFYVLGVLLCAWCVRQRHQQRPGLPALVAATALSEPDHRVRDAFAGEKGTQLQARAMHPALQRADGAAGNLGGILVRLLLQHDHL